MAVLAADGDRILTGSAAAAQRLADALRIRRGSYPLVRDYGSSAHRALDRRPAAIYPAVAETIAHAANGLADVRLRQVRVAAPSVRDQVLEGLAAEGTAVVEVDAAWAEPDLSPAPRIAVRASLVPSSPLLPAEDLGAYSRAYSSAYA